MRYGMQEQRRSRNMAVVGMLGVMAMTFGAGFALYAERTIGIPAAQKLVVRLIQPEFRVVTGKLEKPEVKKILTEESEFRIPEEVAPEVIRKPEPEVVKTQEPRLEPKAVVKPEPKPKNRPKPVKKAKPVRKTVAQEKLPEVSESAEEATGVSGNAAVSVPAAVGSMQAENDRRSAVLAAVLQAVEKHKRYPRQGRRSGAEGTCILMVQVGEDGRVISYSLAGGSGRSVLDAASERLGEKLVGLYVGTKGKLKVLVPVHYRLTDR